MSAAGQLAYRVGQWTELLPFPVHAALWRTWRAMKAWRLVRLEGLTRAGSSGTMIVAGAIEHDFVAEKFFAAAPARTDLGRVPPWGLARRLRALGGTANLTVRCVDDAWAPFLARTDGLPVPEWVCLTTAAVANLQGCAGLSNSARRDERRRRNEEFVVVESTDPADGEAFFEGMVRPHVSLRHADAQLSRAALRHVMRRGVLLWVKEGGERVAGILGERRGDRLVLCFTGVARGDPALLQRGALAAAYVHAIEYGGRVGCGLVDLGGSRPWLSDGVLRYKLKWRPRLDPRRLSAHTAWLRWPAGDAAVAAMLREHPVISRRGDTFSFVGAEAAWPPRLEPARDGEWPELPARASRGAEGGRA